MSSVLKYAFLFFEKSHVVPSDSEVDNRASIFEDFLDDELPIVWSWDFWTSFCQAGVGHLELIKALVQGFCVRESD
ncbi:hypothetical protein HMPREF2807_06275 [Corynebacterium sp. HMSC074A09]|nr:hypothetical protein HMPREF2807_06275 [Corynebacterium sp. HMSC074A09]OFR62628.1 hypothetical protein HMPREF2875_01200 [Corynebacterium sp. HMSC078H07]